MEPRESPGSILAPAISLNEAPRHETLAVRYFLSYPLRGAARNREVAQALLPVAGVERYWNILPRRARIRA